MDIAIIDLEEFDTEYGVDAPSLFNHVLRLTRQGFVYNTGESWDGCMTISTSDDILPDEVGEAMYRFWADTDEDSETLVHEGNLYVFHRSAREE